jgi:cytosine/adenosine deaminase-related metal-dependent hydrolase
VETSTVDLLEKTLAFADELKVPMATHAAYSVLEFHDIVREHQMTPIELLDSIGMLRTTLNIGHGNFIADNPNLNYSGARDLELMGSHQCSISHCPINIARRGRALDNWKRYRDAGINISIGSDTYPRDMVMNMRTASLMGKIMGHDYYKAPAGEVFEAATLGGARSLGRGDLGKLAVGALADIVIIDFAGRQSLRYGPVRDPIKSLVECGIGDDIDTVIVNGNICMENGVIPGLDIDHLRRQAQSSGEHVWATVQDWDPRGRTADQASPWSFPLHSC